MDSKLAIINDLKVLRDLKVLWERINDLYNQDLSRDLMKNTEKIYRLGEEAEKLTETLSDSTD
uniref:Uncharacterized protein n=1 Tax=Pithovirus LCDPAC01 TaxID=2506600 RepID=A0A4D5XEX2_9VIRU|nr:MAG: hypothetical protein LCDPAC01_02680 [Pithovirus LCDPAC01]